ncbi:RHS repeat-associated core domain-containing protein [Archangium sp.]|jgi:RHS repeat-associated protein|uniref:RHS repeat-associated core domain-containing protein n=1 Tax=Archangium sp. TaxID=1872627 RepID=UPI002EDA4D1F
MTPGAVDPVRVAVVRGRVLDRDSNPVADVSVHVHGKPELGTSKTRADGTYDLVINGGGTVTLGFEKAGVLPLQRKVQPPLRDWVQLDDVVVTPLDPAVTAIDFSAPIQVHRATTQTDGDGPRRATLLFTQGTTAGMEIGDKTLPLTSLHVRATEYTVGSRGREAMPGELPASSAYTYAVELSVDEAIQAGASRVVFSKPVVTYVENFLQFTTGTQVPVGYYDRDAAHWVPSDNGRVVKVLSITDGLADLDVTGSGTPSDAATLGALGITDVERAQLATLYAPNATLWRVTMTHFTPWDCNWPYTPPDDAIPPLELPPDIENDDPEEDPECTGGSIIETQNGTLGERLPLAGTSLGLNYRSTRVPGPRSLALTRTVRLTGPTVPASLLSVEFHVTVAGRHYTQSFAAAPNLSAVVSWDGKDAYGRTLTSPTPMSIDVGFVYRAQYRAASGNAFERAFNRPSLFGTDGFSRDRARQEITLWRKTRTTLGRNMMGKWLAQGVGLGGFTLDVHHTYDALTTTLELGNGTRRSGTRLAQTGGYLRDLGMPARDIAFGADGTLYGINKNTLWRKKPGGDFERFAGADNNTNESDGDGGSALLARLWRPRFLAVGPDESVYFTQAEKIRRIRTDGIIERIAGVDYPAPSSLEDGAPAKEAFIYNPTGIAVARDGTIYFSERTGSVSTRPSGIRSITTDGRIHYLYDVDWYESYHNPTQGGPLVLDSEGNLYVASSRVLRFTPSGVKKNLFELFWARGVALTPSGSLLVTDITKGYELQPDKSLTPFLPALVVKGGPDEQTYPNVRVSPTGDIYVMPYALATRSNYETDNLTGNLHLYMPSKKFDNGDSIIPSDDGEEVYVFDAEGRHKRTMSKAGVTLWQFTYDAAGHLHEVTDRNGLETTIEHDTAGNPTAIVAPGGQRTTLAVDANGYLSKLTYPAGESISLTYTPEGLLTRLEDRRGGIHTFDYDANGHLVKDTDPAGHAKTLAATYSPSGRSVIVTNPSGRTQKYETGSNAERPATGNLQRTTTVPTGGAFSVSAPGDGSNALTTPDGTKLTVWLKPDERWGLQAPYRGRVQMQTPLGKTLETKHARTVSLAIPVEPVSLTKQIDTFTTNGRTTTRTYDTVAHTVTTVSPEGRTSVVTLDEKERPIAMSADVAAIPEPVRLTYDSRGRRTQVAQGNLSQTLEFDASDRPIASSDALGRKTRFAYDAADRVSKVTLPSGKVYTLGHDAAGNQTSVQMPSGAIHQLAYDSRDFMSGYTPAGGERLSLLLDGDHRLTRMTLPGGRLLDHTYDEGGRLVGTAYAEATVALTYHGATDRLATLTRTSTPAATPQGLSFTFDGGLVTGIAMTGDARGAYTFLYDNNFFVTGLQLDGGAVSSRTRDRDGLLVGLGPFSLTRSGPAGLLSSIQQGTTTVETMTYDTLGREATRTLSPAGVMRYSATLGYDVAGQPATKLETVAGKNRQFEYTYDSDGQLVNVQRTDVDTGAVSCEVYAYDVNGNRTQRKAGTCGAEEVVETATFDAQDRLLTRGAVAHTFDAAGFLTRRGGDSFVYSARGEMLEATVDAGLPGETVITYGYDGLGRRTTRTDALGTTQYLYSSMGFALTHSRSPTGVLSEYFYDDAGRLFALTRAGQTYYVATDTVGSPRLVTDAAGTIVLEVEYDAFGRIVSGDPTAFELPIGFAGGIPDARTKLVRFGHRDYDPEAGRWTARDPVLYGGGQFNLYAYARNEPILHVDRSGLASTICEALSELAAKEKKEGGPRDYANSVLKWFEGQPLTVNDGNVSNPIPFTYGSTVGGVDFNYFETTYAGSRQLGSLVSGYYNTLITTGFQVAHLVVKGSSLSDVAKNFVENMGGIVMGLDAQRYPSIEAYRKSVCCCEK